jgi:hypothetical protein
MVKGMKLTPRRGEDAKNPTASECEVASERDVAAERAVGVAERWRQREKAGRGEWSGAIKMDEVAIN